MKTTHKHLEIFKKECLKWQDKFELHNWELNFRWQHSDESRASINTNLNGYVATIFLSEEWNSYNEITEKDIKLTAKHEMIHLLLARMDAVTRARFVSIDEAIEADEETVMKLTYLL